MTLVPVSRLSVTELRMLGNNLTSRTRRDRELGAVNRSIAVHGEEVDELAPLGFVPVKLTKHRRLPEA